MGSRRRLSPLERKAAAMVGGKNAQINGRLFESMELGIAGRFFGVHIPMGCKRVAGGKLVAVRSPFDWAGCLPGGRGIYWDAKRCGKSFAGINLADPDFCPSQQITNLARARAMGAIAGYAVHASELREWRWIDAGYFDRLELIKWEDPRWIILGEAKEPATGNHYPWDLLINLYTLHAQNEGPRAPFGYLAPRFRYWPARI